MGQQSWLLRGRYEAVLTGRVNIIYESALGIDKLPKIYLRTSITFLWYVITPFLTFFLTMVAVQLPFCLVDNAVTRKIACRYLE